MPPDGLSILAPETANGIKSTELMKTKVTVVMAVYNAEQFLDQSIRSVLEQTLCDLELIIVDDGSNDRSTDIIRDFAARDSRITWLSNPENLGPSDTRNRAIDLAQGEYIAILDSDDICFPSRLAVQAEFLDQNPKIALVGCGAVRIDEHGTRIGRHLPILGGFRLGKRLERRNRLYHSTVMYRNLGYRYRNKLVFAEDYDLYLQMLSDGLQLSEIPTALVAYRVHKQGISCAYAGKLKLFAERALQFYWQRMASNKDEYETFDPNTIMRLDAQTTNNRTILKHEIKASLKQRNHSQLRQYCKRYFRTHGYNWKLFSLYLSSFGMDFFVKTINSVKFRS